MFVHAMVWIGHPEYFYEHLTLEVVQEFVRPVVRINYPKAPNELLSRVLVQ